MEVVGTILLVLSAIIALEFVLAYHLSTKGFWRKTQMGRHLMAFSVSIAAVLSLATTSRITQGLGADDPTWFTALRLGVFISIPIVLVWRRVLLTKLQRSKERNEVD